MSQKASSAPVLGPGRWAAYTAASLASAVALTSEAEAGIVYVDIPDVVLSATPMPFVTGSTSFVLKSTGGASILTFYHRVNSVGTFGAASAVGNAANAGQLVGFVLGSNYASNVPLGLPLTAGLPFLATGTYGLMAVGFGYPNSEFVAAGTAFVGFQFDTGSGPQFGWARVVMDGATLNSYTITDFAYSTAGTPIAVGDTSAVPEPTSLGMLAMGAVGALATRRRRAGTGRPMRRG